MIEPTKLSDRPQIRCRVVPGLLATIDCVVIDGRFSNRNDVIEHAISAYFAASPDRLQDLLFEHAELLAFSLFSTLATLRTQLTDDEVSTIIAMAEDLYLGGIPVPIEVLRALGYADEPEEFTS